ncbi:hypothetical protein COY61_00775 [bacterium (Candidatus Gribaldobacteria) CG_4_10_14_0_8_um_filter_33_9]|uniref:HEPN domain-containing protein n=1 Tax=bacterium (Candidatus Gribaldobacteria) CG_4_10_14_0_8_um_filter_33_9 TaxID=2014266 RepID=A0A2M7RNM5_9BACT|nr:MAG: hypothetical protein COY61_00775 [bacterium (Candidatus Gribaldobacteria) CG_4_10_14_0_8_um_filter_33_9]
MSNRDKNWDDYIYPRIDDLIKKDFYLEAFYLCSATIEHTLQSAIQIQEKWIKNVINHSGLKFRNTDFEKLSNFTLGRLISYFSRYCDNVQLISELNKFNSLRIKFVHKLLDFSLKELNEEAKINFEIYWKLVAKLSRYMIWINCKQIRSIKRKMRRGKGARYCF